MFYLGLYFQTQDLPNTKVVLKLGSKKFWDRSSMIFKLAMKISKIEIRCFDLSVYYGKICISSRLL